MDKKIVAAALKTAGHYIDVDANVAKVEIASQKCTVIWLL